MSDSDFSILLVEDDPDQVFLMQKAFKRAGKPAGPRVARDGMEAIEILSLKESQHPTTPAIILLDLKLPRKSGFEVLEWIQGRPGLKALTVIVLTASDDPTDQHRARNLGASSFILKPVSYDDLVRIVESLPSYSDLRS